MPPIENIKFGAAVLAVVLLLSASHLLDGPSETESAQASADDAVQAPVEVREQARREWLEQFAEVRR